MDRSLKSLTAGGSHSAKEVAAQAFTAFAEHYPRKLYWFAKGEKPYMPHEWQAAFHTARTPSGLLCRFRHLVAGRRGGKTMSAAKEVAYYSLHPEEWWWDVRGVESTEPLWINVLAEDHEVGRPARIAFQQALIDAGLRKEKDYKWNKTEKSVEFDNGTYLQFRTAEDPQSLRGAGLNILWVDEAAFVPSREAWDVIRPALSDKQGQLITTTTPDGKNWLWEEFWSPEAQADTKQFRVEYVSIDNPYFPKEEWEYAKLHLHPVVFAREYMASFDAMSGVELNGEWLKYWTRGNPEKGEIRIPQDESGNLRLRKFMAVDPAASLADTADYFAMALVGINDTNTQVYLIDTFKDRLTFPEQIDKIAEWFQEHRPEMIGVEANAFQRVLEQQAHRIEGFPNVVPIISRAKKHERILAMAPVFKTGKVRINRSHGDFIDEWIGYDSTKKNPRDDVLDAVEVALGLAGVLLPNMPITEHRGPSSIHEEAWEQIRAQGVKSGGPFDPELGDNA